VSAGQCVLYCFKKIATLHLSIISLFTFFSFFYLFVFAQFTVRCWSCTRLTLFRLTILTRSSKFQILSPFRGNRLRCPSVLQKLQVFVQPVVQTILSSSSSSWTFVTYNDYDCKYCWNDFFSSYAQGGERGASPTRDYPKPWLDFLYEQRCLINDY
jgi:hypothetical protein